MITAILRDWCCNFLYTYLIPLKYDYENEQFNKIQYSVKLLRSFHDSLPCKHWHLNRPVYYISQLPSAPRKRRADPAGSRSHGLTRLRWICWASEPSSDRPAVSPSTIVDPAVYIRAADRRPLHVYDARGKTAVNAAARRKGRGALAFWAIGFCVPCMHDETVGKKESHGLYSLKGYFLCSSLPLRRTSCATNSIPAIAASFA